MDKFNLKNIKDFLPLITIIPVILGWIIQIIFLWNFWISYIRFFSLSQSLIDGLVIMWVCLSVWLWLFLPDFFSSFYYNSITSSNKFIRINSKTALYSEIFWIFVLFLIPFYITHKMYLDIVNNGYITIFSLLIVSFIFSLFLNFWINKLSFLLHSYKFEDKIIDWSSIRDNLKLFILNIFCILIFSFIFYKFDKTELSANSIYTIFSLPNNLINSTNLHLENNSNKVVYYNDKYIFIKNTTNNTIRIVKFDDLFK